MYQAVIELVGEGANLNNLTVAEITGKAGIGKGTAYEYFSNKEDIIAGALFYEIRQICEQLYEELPRKKSLYEKIELILISMEKNMMEANCLLQVLHIMLENSAISERLQELMGFKEKRHGLIVDMMRCVVEDELGALEEIEESRLTYLTMMLFSRIVCYGMYLYCTFSEKTLDGRTVRELLCKGVCADVENFKAEL